MNRLQRFYDMFHSMPEWGQYLLTIVISLYALLSLYGRFNVKFGAKIFSKIPAEEIRTNFFHIFFYTAIPLAAAVMFVLLIAGVIV